MVKRIELRLVIVDKQDKHETHEAIFSEFVPCISWLGNVSGKIGRGAVKRFLVFTTITTEEGVTEFQNDFVDRVALLQTMAAGFGAVARANNEETARHAFKLSREGGETPQ